MERTPLLPSQRRSTPAAVFSEKNLRCFGAICGQVCPLLILAHFGAAGWLPPGGADWSASRTAEHYVAHKTGTHISSVLLLFAGIVYFPYTASLVAQLRRIPDVSPFLISLQQVAGAASGLVFFTPAMLLAVTTYRLDRAPEITQALSDLYWITVTVPWGPFLVQNFGFALAVLLDGRNEPVFPRKMVALNLLIPSLWFPTLALHCVHKGPLAWTGIYTFWIVTILTGLQLGMDGFVLMKVIRSEENKD
ncbi:hypothetical protein MY5147_008046 [Beauveria neobassiana]|uniref:Uncharacterized protein n=1 Tax=Beauveria bassiana D1-5 TaxID=1245745 RepID=A0A0A2VBL8_BEABA|nr:hypothetical protein BBAD15_g11064 [Beauveria bassiana D1-5]